MNAILNPPRDCKAAARMHHNHKQFPSPSTSSPSLPTVQSHSHPCSLRYRPKRSKMAPKTGFFRLGLLTCEGYVYVLYRKNHLESPGQRKTPGRFVRIGDPPRLTQVTNGRRPSRKAWEWDGDTAVDGKLSPFRVRGRPQKVSSLDDLNF